MEGGRVTFLQALCGECGEAVDSRTVEAHMDAHGRLLPSDWTLTAWPDGTALIIDPETGLPA
jgi:hypothetical protein